MVCYTNLPKCINTKIVEYISAPWPHLQLLLTSLVSGWMLVYEGQTRCLGTQSDRLLGWGCKTINRLCGWYTLL